MIHPLLSLLRVAVSIGAVLIVTAVYHAVLAVNPTTVALTYVVVVLLAASNWGVVEATTVSIAATVCLNVFFLPPVGTFTIADPQNWVALAVFLVTGIVASQLSGRARRRALEAEGRQRDLEQLYALSRALLLSPGRPTMAAAIARHVAEAFDFSFVAVLDQRADTLAFAGPADHPSVEPRLREVARQGVSREEGSLLVVAIQLGGAPIGSLALPKGDLSDTVVQSIANLAAIGLERARGAEAAARAEAAQEGGQLRATMLDALAHEFKTPLTSMKVAAADLRANARGEDNRELATIIDEDLDRLQSLVNDTVSMVRVDAGDFSLRPDRFAAADLVASTLRQVRVAPRRPRGHDRRARRPGDRRGPRAPRARAAAVARQRREVLAPNVDDRGRRVGRRPRRHRRPQLGPRHSGARTGTAVRAVLPRVGGAPSARDRNGTGHRPTDCRGAPRQRARAQRARHGDRVRHVAAWPESPRP